MPVLNRQVANILDRLADTLDIEGANEFRVRAYKSAAQTIRSLSKNVSEMVENNEDISKLPNIGDSMADKIKEIVETGSLKQLKKAKKRIPEGLIDLLDISNLGPKRVQKLNQELDIKNIDDLKKAAKDEKIREIEGFGKKTEEKILEESEKQISDKEKDRLKWRDAREITEPLLDYLKKLDEIDQIDIAGSYRRCKETIGDLDILVICEDSKKTMEHFVSYEDTDDVISKGDTRSSIRLTSGLQVDLRVVSKKSYGSALVYFTGSKAHNIKIRKIAGDKDLKINEYGVFKGDDQVAGKTEEEVYEQIDLKYIEPELREDRGEIDASRNDDLPKLVTLEDIRGDLQSHTKASDGKYTMEEMVNAAKEKGYDYFAITDHSQRVTMARGLNEKRMEEQIKKMEELNKEIKGIRILKAVEVDILEDGSLDLEDEILKELDVVVCSVHYNRNLSQKKQTKRILKAMENPYFNILGHPTGRIIQKRDPIEVNMEEIFKTAKDYNIHMELNASPERLDLSDFYCKTARETGIKIAISTDAHMKSHLDNMIYGVNQARRGWLEKEDVLNTHKWSNLKKMLKRN
ncbi:DNA polymerase/3'-5' exonuclease PolX [candidate division KSB1 bacterium]|nr:DNA polymerase/3'-5' exonuclease PolX [candidate division KSB1 bacterium]